MLHLLALTWRFILRAIGGERDPRQVFLDQGKAPRVLLVAPGEANMPVQGWGAVEGLVWRHRTGLQQRGWSVDIVNSWKIASWLKCLLRRPALIICHYDDLLLPSLLAGKALNARVVTVSHYPFAHQKELWNKGFLLYSRLIKHADVFVALSEKIRLALDGCCSRVECIHNFVDFDAIRFSEKSSRGVVCVGKVDGRKRQIEVAQALGATPLAIIGPWNLRDSVDDLVVTAKYLGEWSHTELLANLTEFSGLILASRSEADALVIHEARVAGLQVFATESALGSHCGEMPGISVVAEDLSNLERLVLDFQESVDSRCQIRNSALAHSSEARAMERWSDLISQTLGT